MPKLGLCHMKSCKAAQFRQGFLRKKMEEKSSLKKKANDFARYIMIKADNTIIKILKNYLSSLKKGDDGDAI